MFFFWGGGGERRRGKLRRVMGWRRVNMNILWFSLSLVVCCDEV